MLTQAQQRLREYKTTASQVPIIMSGDTDKLIQLWRERIGEIEPEDLSTRWPVQLGSFCETFIADWHQRETGHELVRRQEFVQHPTLDYVSCTIDCYRPFDDTVLDVKVCNAWMSITDIVNYYAGQIRVQQACIGASRGALLLMHGSAEPHEYEVFSDEAYDKEMWGRIAAFQMCCDLLHPPAPLPKIVPPEQYRSVDLEQLEKSAWPNWAHSIVPQLLAWSETKTAADQHKLATDTIKALTPDDVGRISFSDLGVTRNRAGALSIKRVA
jgi:predicted phage-related endonuclease